MIESTFSGIISFWRNLTNSEKLTWLISGVGLVVDVYAIFQILGQVQGVDSNEVGAPIISPWLAFAIWLLSVLGFITFLHAYWQRNRIEEGFNSSFAKFLLAEVLIDFQFPALLFPGAVLLIVLFAITATDEMGIFTFFLGIAVVIMGGGLFVIKGERENPESDIYKFLGPKKVGRETKTWISGHWKYLDDHIQAELSRRFYITPADLSYLETSKGFSYSDISYILAQYAEKNPQEYKYGSLWYRRHSSPDKFDLLMSNALIDLAAVDYEKYGVS